MSQKNKNANIKKKTQPAPLLAQMGIYASILFISNIISSLAPASFPVPAPVVGMILLYSLLSLHIIKVEWVDSFGAILISLIGFLFVPSGISLAANLGIMKAEGLQIVTVIIISTIILLLVTAYTARFFIWLKKKHPAQTKNATTAKNVSVHALSRAKGEN
ncbi:effector of murein hydrolase LrgA [Liquorilactobacillus aquaticus DSM 21051]|uniref:Effector of murein hydrolase LrgA n=1 Tax=Liquorilactobacillus aquaticus DSM 21051 TaxID=1423725 RepID=A0A0R2CZS9_9LACO|nr:CidA/LrgA family protein [Liquorilactobacillus aquaticus]KRM96965.1 effector of murein hydrolase LrgA [Liquorilactobacillus aquaticus DSM 21051]